MSGNFNREDSTMRTTWTVTKITATPNLTIADLRRVEWFKKNPAWDEDAFDDAAQDEFIDAEPGEPGAESIEAEGKLSIEITDGLDLKPGDALFMTLQVVDRVLA